MIAVIIKMRLCGCGLPSRNGKSGDYCKVCYRDYMREYMRKRYWHNKQSGKRTPDAQE